MNSMRPCMAMARALQSCAGMKSAPPPALVSSPSSPSQDATDTAEARNLRSTPPPAPAPRRGAAERHAEATPRAACRRPWSLRRTKDGATVIATFRGKLGESEGRTFAASFAEELSWAPAHIIWNLTEMTGYEAAARVAWQDALLPLRHRIRSLEVVGGGPLVRVGAVTLAMVLGVDARFVEGPPTDGERAGRSNGQAAA